MIVLLLPYLLLCLRLVIVLPRHHLFDLLQRMLFWRVDEPLDVAAQWHLLDPLHIAFPNVYVLLRIDQLPAHPRDHRSVVRAVSWLRVGAGHLVFLGKLVE